MKIRKFKRKVYSRWLRRDTQRWHSRRPEGYKSVYESAPRYLACFKRWLATMQDEFPVPLRIENRCKWYIRLSFHNSRGFVRVYVVLGEIKITALWQGECIDSLVWLDMNQPIRDKAGHIVCQHCATEERPFYAKVEDFWKHEIFDSFLQWTKGKYAPAVWLGMYRRDGASWASLELERPKKESEVTCLACIPLYGGSR